MTIPNIPEGMRLSLPPLNDINMRIILSYSPSVFSQTDPDSVCMSRIAEIFMLSEMRPLAEKLNALTGIIAPSPNTTADELITLIDRCEVIIRTEKDKLEQCKRNASQTEHALMALKQPAQSVSDSRKRSKQAINEAEVESERATLNLIKKTEYVMEMQRVTGLLYNEVIISGHKEDIQRCMPSTSRIPSLFTRRSDVLFNATADTCDSVRSLRLAVEDVVRKCTPPTDKYEISHGGLIKAEAYRHYYHVDNDLLRAIISADEYAKYIASHGWFMQTATKSGTANITPPCDSHAFRKQYDTHGHVADNVDVNSGWSGLAEKLK